MPIRIQRKRTKGWKMPPGCVCCTRPGKYGNPYTIKNAREAGYGGTDRELSKWCVDLFRKAVLLKDSGMYASSAPSLEDVKALAGKDLACWCHLDQPCHVDVLLELANPAAPPVEER